MHKSFYASGFLYSPKLHQILLLKFPQKDRTDFLWSTMGGEGGKGEEAQVAFQRIINGLLGLNLKAKDIYPIYDYFHDKRGEINYVFYAEIKNPSKLRFSQEDKFSWIGFDEISKLLFTARSKQDVIVGERVINAKWREAEARKLALFPEPAL